MSIYTIKLANGDIVAAEVKLNPDAMFERNAYNVAYAAQLACDTNSKHVFFAATERHALDLLAAWCDGVAFEDGRQIEISYDV